MFSEKDHQLHIFFFPFMAHGHMIPTIDMAKLFASRGVKSTVITTPLNAPLVSKSIQGKTRLSLQIDIQILNFPLTEAGLPEGCENMDVITSQNLGWEMAMKFLTATTILQDSLEQLLQNEKPDCLVADMFFPWTTSAASKFGIPRLVFHGTSFFSLSVTECLRLYKPHEKVSSDSEPFIVPNFPGEIKLTRNQMPLPDRLETETDFSNLFRQVREVDSQSYGAVVNSFYELEPAYADYYRKIRGRRAWHIGPLSLCNRDIEEKVIRGAEAAISEHECLKWLNSKNQNSIIYICFGSMANFSSSQLKEIAVALEASGQEFVWVVRRRKKSNQDSNEEDWLPEGFEKRIEGKGLIIRGWAPQVLILDHEAVGGFVTHCGWNSTLEGVTAGLPMVTWPVSAEQFYNEKLITDVLKIGVGVGAKQWVHGEGDSIESKAIEKGINKIMEGEEAEEMRRRARSLGEMAKKAVQEGGSSSSDLDSLIDELKLHGYKI